ncbi:MEDS domain-containing protein [Virgibacillus flavescens]|uniref:MEDS domain-containing protein n=1 Tax=Virgibacillus flavescens TaxID=1611422 RepID=UPI003D332736
MTKFIPLTNYLEISSPAHILYFFEEMKCYLKNMLAYIKAGIERDHHVLVLERREIFSEVEYECKQLFSENQLKCIHYIDNYSFYQRYGDFQINNIVKHFGEVLAPFFEKDINVRIWAHVEWNENKAVSTTLEMYERMADHRVKEMGLISVCAYSGSGLSASLQNSLLKCHEYLMTDEVFVRSSLYKNPKLKNNETDLT